MQTFFTETFFADITTIYDVELEEIQMIVSVFHYKRRLAIIASVDNVQNYLTLWYGVLHEGFEVDDFV